MPDSFEALRAEFTRAVNDGDLDALCALYAPDAVFVTGPGASPAVSGTAAIREVFKGFLANKPVTEYRHAFVYENGGMAFARGEWKLTSRGPDGTEQSITGSSFEVFRRDSDGSWRFIADHPWGAA